MPPKAKKKDREDNDVLTRIAIVSADRCSTRFPAESVVKQRWTESAHLAAKLSRLNECCMHS